MALIQITSAASSGGGGGGLTITGWTLHEHEQTTNFTAGTLVITLPQTPLTINAVMGNYNGDTIYPIYDFTLSGNQITIVWDDPYVTDYDTPPVFRFQYPY